MKSPWMLSAVACFGLMLCGCSTPSSVPSNDPPVSKPATKPVDTQKKTSATEKQPTPATSGGG